METLCKLVIINRWYYTYEQAMWQAQPITILPAQERVALTPSDLRSNFALKVIMSSKSESVLSSSIRRNDYLPKVLEAGNEPTFKFQRSSARATPMWRGIISFSGV